MLSNDPSCSPSRDSRDFPCELPGRFRSCGIEFGKPSLSVSKLLSRPKSRGYSRTAGQSNSAMRAAPACDRGHLGAERLILRPLMLIAHHRGSPKGKQLGPIIFAGSEQPHDGQAHRHSVRVFAMTGGGYYVISLSLTQLAPPHPSSALPTLISDPDDVSFCTSWSRKIGDEARYSTSTDQTTRFYSSFGSCRASQSLDHDRQEPTATAGPGMTGATQRTLGAEPGVVGRPTDRGLRLDDPSVTPLGIAAEWYTRWVAFLKSASLAA